MQEIRSRDASFDVVKCIAIWLVMYGHCIQHLSLTNRLDNWAYLFVYSFHMPLFMLISGYFSSNSYKLDLKSFLIKKGKALILPVITFSFVMTCLNFVLYNETWKSPMSFIYTWWEHFNTWLWFLRSLFICYLLTYLGEHLGKKYKFIYYIAICILLAFIRYCNLSFLYPCFLVGLLFRRKDIIDRLNNGRYFIIFFIVFMLLSLFWNSSIFIDSTTVAFNAIPKYLMLLSYRIILGISGAICVILAIKLLLKNIKKSKTLKFICDIGGAHWSYMLYNVLSLK